MSRRTSLVGSGLRWTLFSPVVLVLLGCLLGWYSQVCSAGPPSFRNTDEALVEYRAREKAVQHPAITQGALGSFPYEPRSIDRWKLEDFILVGTIDGSLQARDRNTGLEVWSIPGDRPLVEVVSGNSTMSPEDRDITWIVEPYGDGMLYYFMPSTGLQKLPVGIKQLVLESPFAINGDDKIYTGTRQTTLYSINASTGEILKVYGAGSSTLGKAECRSRDPNIDIEEDSGREGPYYSSGAFMIGRTDYHLEIHGKNQTIWNVTYSSWGPNNMDSDLQSQHVYSPDSLYITPLHNNSILALTLDNRSKPARWIGDTSSMVVNVFDAFYDGSEDVHSTLYKPNNQRIILLPQPSYSFNSVPDKDSLYATYVEQTSSGQWFALSGKNYPSLVSSAPIAKWCLSEKHDNLNLADSLVGVHPKVESAKIYESGVAPYSPSEGNHPTSRPRTSKRPLYIEGPQWDGIPLTISPPPHTQNALIQFLKRVLENIASIVVLGGIIYGITRLGIFPYGVVLTGRKAVEEVIIPEIKIEPPEEIKQDQQVKEEDEVSDKTEVGDDEPKVKFVEDEKSQAKSDEKLVEKPTGKTDDKPDKRRKRKRGKRGGKNNQSQDKREPLQAAPLIDESLRKVEDTTGTPLRTSSDVSESNDVNLQSSPLTVSEEIIGYGSQGTTVYKGTYENREVAVKRMLLNFYDIASQEVSLLQESDDHMNVIRYYCKHQSSEFLYIALELCSGTLEDIVEKRGEVRELRDRMSPTNVLSQIANGVQHLHSLKIVHRDIKPQNILVAPPKKHRKRGTKEDEYGPIRMVISDFGLCKKLETEQSSFRATTAQPAGTAGWTAPEISLARRGNRNLDESQEDDDPERRRLTRAVDIFSMGCVFYYILTDGKHPFGENSRREANIEENNFTLDDLGEDGEPGVYEAKDLIRRMISYDPRDRPDAYQVLSHPFFWSAQKKLDFLLKISDRFEADTREEVPTPLLQQLEKDCGHVVGKDWHDRLDKAFIENLGKYRKYHGDRVIDLLRAMRNKSHHFNDFPPNLQKSMGPFPEGFVRYFTKRYPDLLMSVYYFAEEYLKEEPLFATFYEWEDPHAI